MRSRYAFIAFPLILGVAAIAEVMMYAIAQKEQLGFDKAVEECSAPMPATTSIAPLLTFACPCAPEYRMSRYGVTPNVNQPPTRTYALPIRMTLCLTLARVCRRR